MTHAAGVVCFGMNKAAKISGLGSEDLLKKLAAVPHDDDGNLKEYEELIEILPTEDEKNRSLTKLQIIKERIKDLRNNFFTEARYRYMLTDPEFTVENYRRICHEYYGVVIPVIRTDDENKRLLTQAQTLMKRRERFLNDQRKARLNEPS